MSLLLPEISIEGEETALNAYLPLVTTPYAYNASGGAVVVDYPYWQIILS